MPSIFVASSIVGFASFAFTFFTFLRVFWESIMTMWAAPREVRGYLDNLRSELYGERDYFKAATKSSKSKGKGVSRSHHDVGPLKILNDSVKHLMHKFKNLEEPFLRDPPSRKQMDVEKSEPSLRGDYLDMSLGLRYIWLRTKPDIITLANDVTRIQMRRLAFDTGSVLSWVYFSKISNSEVR